MTDNECRCRIRETSTARLRVLDGTAPGPVDVTYSVHGNTLVLRPGTGLRPGVVGRGRSAMLEIDHGTSEARTSWRVVVTGNCEPIATDVADPAIRDASGELLELRIHFLEGRHDVAEALPPSSVVPQPRRPLG
jgi:nitroimidazol reductase NimA-like FMN-containing flavoprotein (pyridoxamine 5'-phosphate oxidase superfamily)